MDHEMFEKFSKKEKSSTARKKDDRRNRKVARDIKKGKYND